MAASRNETDRIAFGDFQTPPELARRVCQRLTRCDVNPKSIVEPTCGEGVLLRAAVDTFRPSHAIGLEINPSYVRHARRQLGGDAKIRQADFFVTDWPAIFKAIETPVLVIGNPPWVTSSVLGSNGGNNLPTKSNLRGLRGIDAITGKANFDISEWMLTRLLEAIDRLPATIAMLCKTTVARKILHHLWSQESQGTRATCPRWIDRTSIYRIDAKRYFGASVDACLFVMESRDLNRSHQDLANSRSCDVYDSLESTVPTLRYGYRDKTLVADVDAYDKHHNWIGQSDRYRWRSGIKHDCSKVMELIDESGVLYNGFGEAVDIEDQVLFPMIKSSDVAGGRARHPSRWMIVTQQVVGQETTERLRHDAPRTLEYLSRHGSMLDARRSSIYRNRPRFSIFGVGPYSFSKAKVAVSSLYKRIHFEPVGTHQGKPIVLDDTCYAVACDSQREASQLAAAMNSESTQSLLSAFVFPDAKRAVTVGILQQLNLENILSSHSTKRKEKGKSQ